MFVPVSITIVFAIAYSINSKDGRKECFDKDYLAEVGCRLQG